MKTDNKILDLNTDLKILLEWIQVRTENSFTDYELLKISHLIFMDRKFNTYKLSEKYRERETQFINDMLQLIEQKL
jgi:hypothetical protein